jgi:hypothetical protein
MPQTTAPNFRTPSGLCQSHNTPVLHIQMQQPLQLLTVSFLWETALILASVRLQLNPFHLSDNRIPRTFCDELLDGITRGEDPLRRSPGLTINCFNFLPTASLARKFPP